MSAPDLREPVLEAVKASLAAACPLRVVARGLHDPAELGNKVLQQGHYSVVASGMGDWNTNVGSEGTEGRLRFVIVFHGMPGPNATPLEVEQLEGQAQAELLAWVRGPRPGALATIYPLRANYSQGLEAPVAWVYMELEALYV